LSEPDKKEVELPKGLVYPCEFPLKVFIKPDEEVATRIAAVLHAQLATGATVDVSRRISSTGKYLALTLNFIAEDAEHLDRVIKAVMADPGVILAL
jgi:putative lipoic acid-binding regulatory protein